MHVHLRAMKVHEVHSAAQIPDLSEFRALGLDTASIWTQFSCCHYIQVKDRLQFLSWEDLQNPPICLSFMEKLSLVQNIFPLFHLSRKYHLLTHENMFCLPL